MTQIVLGGVGGQGIVSLGRIILDTAIENNQPAIGVETHGLSQRGGSVVFHARIGTYNSPLVPLGQANYLISLEAMETLRYINYIHPKGTVIMNTRQIVPGILTQQGKDYPELQRILKPLQEHNINYFLIPALDIATQLNQPRSENMVLLGALLYMEPVLQLDLVKEHVAKKWPKAQQANLQAIDKGYEYAKQHSAT